MQLYIISKVDHLPILNINGSQVIAWVNNYILYTIASWDFIISDNPDA